jgi:NAD-dependent deacetylase
MTDNNKPNLVVLCGAGISQESGLNTFRDTDGLWEGHKIEDVATPEAWNKDQLQVLKFYNLRRKAVLEAIPNAAHIALKNLETHFNVQIITQNVDDLHERAGSKNIMHLHGKILESRSTLNQQLIYPIIGSDLNKGDLCELGSQLRPNIVWFGEDVPMIKYAAEWVENAAIFLIIGTSLQVYPAAGLIRYHALKKPLYAIDPKPLVGLDNFELRHLQKTAVNGMDELEKTLVKLYA